jgi:hypothetical protein
MVSYLWAGLDSAIYGFLHSAAIIILMRKMAVKNKMDDPTKIVSVILFHALTIYTLAHMPQIQLSGDVAIIVYTFNLRNYGLHNLFPRTAFRISVITIYCKELAEQMAFLSMGMCVTTYFWQTVNYRTWAITCCLMLIWALTTFAVGFIHNCRKKRYRLGEEMFLCSAKMIKGDLTYVLFGIMMVHEWNPRLSVMVYSMILWTYVIWTPIHYFLSVYVF